MWLDGVRRTRQIYIHTRGLLLTLFAATSICRSLHSMLTLLDAPTSDNVDVINLIIIDSYIINHYIIYIRIFDNFLETKVVSYPKTAINSK